ncbi:antitermination protein [Escherichia coli]|nr:antitermination protein [Escherichia coli]EIZ6832577.1 antitermination protein [Escherichia coli]EIZ6841460.1 antitermination protein [Escherichia coli]EIZ6878294.1 antitermination protein [Escherichia coli]
MKLEDLPKYYSPKSPGLTDASASTSKDALSITDVMAAQGMTQNRAEMGFSAFLGKMGISMNDRERATELLTEYALSRCDRVAALRKLPAEIKPAVMRIMASYAFEDYARSAASKKQCSCCHGKKFIESEVFTNKIQYPDGKSPVWAKCTKGVYPSYWEEWKQVRETVKLVCPVCEGKGQVSVSCRDCRGRGVAVHREESEKQGVPVFRSCQRCAGRGYERLPSTEVFNAICCVTSLITRPSWEKTVKQFYDALVGQFDIEEAWAEQQLKEATR